ncbi:MAG: hypothetical protein HY453_01195 [Parcubacteria group bacterium]|nr:hypothetical protein [Parcubacteria group bacterium]
MKPSFGLDKIKFATDQPTYEKAVVLYESGKVTRFEEGIGAYSAVVLGTRPYRVSIEARRFGLGNCECYLGQQDTLCKHMVALSIHAVMNGKKLAKEDKNRVSSPICSGKRGELSKEGISEIKKAITSAMSHIKPYNVPSRLWFSYQNSLDEGCARLAKLVSDLPVSVQTAELLVDLLLRLDKKLCTGGVDDSNGTVGGFIEEVVLMLQEYAKLDNKCVRVFEKLCGKETCFGWEESLVKIVDEGLS